jgi:hypothetical protein
MANKKLSWLEEVKADARHNTLKRIKEQKETEAYEQSKKTGNPMPGEGGNFPSELPKEEKGKKQ